MDISLHGYTYEGAEVAKEQYRDGSLALTINDPLGDHIATVSVWIATAPAEGCIWVKDYSENQGILAALVEAGVLETTGREQAINHVTLPEARVLV